MALQLGGRGGAHQVSGELLFGGVWVAPRWLVEEELQLHVLQPLQQLRDLQRDVLHLGGGAGGSALPPRAGDVAAGAAAVLCTWLRLFSSSSWRLSVSLCTTSQRWLSCCRLRWSPSTLSPRLESSKPCPASLTDCTVRAWDITSFRSTWGQHGAVTARTSHPARHLGHLPCPLRRCHHGTGPGERRGKGQQPQCWDAQSRGFCPPSGTGQVQGNKFAASWQGAARTGDGRGWGHPALHGPPRPTCTSQHPADGRHGTSVPGQGEGDSSLLPCCHHGRGRVLTPPAPNHRPAWPSHHRPGARRLAMGRAVPGGEGEQCPAAEHGPTAGGPREGPDGAMGPHGRTVSGPSGGCPREDAQLQGHAANGLGAAQVGACREPRATAALTLCLASSISQLCRSRRSSVGPCSCSEVRDSHCSSSSSWCWNCPRPSRAASSWCCRRQGQDQAPVWWGAGSALPTRPAPRSTTHRTAPRTHAAAALTSCPWQIWSPAHAPPAPPRSATPTLPRAWDCPALPEPPSPGG